MHFQCIFTSSVLNIYRLDVVSAQTPPHISPFNSQPLSAADKDAADKTEVQFVVSHKSNCQGAEGATSATRKNPTSL